jgi:hypothetical protein
MSGHCADSFVVTTKIVTPKRVQSSEVLSKEVEIQEFVDIEVLYKLATMTRFRVQSDSTIEMPREYADHPFCKQVCS